MRTQELYRRILGTLIAIVAIGAASGFAATVPGAHHAGTIAGRVYGGGGPHALGTRGPRPVAGVTVVAASTRGERVARTVSRTGGVFKLQLAPGRYKLSARVGGRLCGFGRHVFTVRAGRITRANLDCSLR
jgi:hypothetical protein